MPRRRAQARSKQLDDPKRFVEDCYQRLLGRAPDPAGLDTFVQQLAGGTPPSEIVMAIAMSDEYRERVVLRRSPRRRRPTRYHLAGDASDVFWVFDVRDDADFDELERTILDDGYYERHGIWSFEPDADKRVMGALLADLGAKRALEIGCSAGAVLGVLDEHGIYAEGVEISAFARNHARPDIRDRIHVGELPELALPSDYDLVFGLDVFEHLNPNRLRQYLDALRARVRTGGLAFANIPAFGNDDVFGEVFPLYVASWNDDVAANRPFRVLHCDDDGYPMNGHLIWAHTTWWVAQFRAAGFARVPEVERPLHERYAEHFIAEPARRSFFVFRAE